MKNDKWNEMKWKMVKKKKKVKEEKCKMKKGKKNQLQVLFLCKFIYIYIFNLFMVNSKG